MPLTYSDLPNWRNRNEYPQEKDFCPSQWAWEFLRRNEDYRKAWCEFESAAFQVLEKLPGLEMYRQDARSLGGIAVAVKNAFDDGFREGIGNLMRRTGIDAQQWSLMRQVQELSILTAHPWMLADMLDPCMSFHEKVPFRVETVISQTGSERKTEAAFHRWLTEILSETERLPDTRPFSIDNEWTHNPFQLHLSIDMRVPIGVVKKQLCEEIERRYKEAENLDFMRIKKRTRADKYTNYLRVLDALRLNENADEIGSVIFPGQYADDIPALRKQVDQTIDAAKKEQENYWLIAHLD